MAVETTMHSSARNLDWFGCSRVWISLHFAVPASLSVMLGS